MDRWLRSIGPLFVMTVSHSQGHLRLLIALSVLVVVSQIVRLTSRCAGYASEVVYGGCIRVIDTHRDQTITRRWLPVDGNDERREGQSVARAALAPGLTAV